MKKHKETCLNCQLLGNKIFFLKQQIKILRKELSKLKGENSYKEFNTKAEGMRELQRKKIQERTLIFCKRRELTNRLFFIPSVIAPKEAITLPRTSFENFARFNLENGSRVKLGVFDIEYLTKECVEKMIKNLSKISNVPREKIFIAKIGRDIPDFKIYAMYYVIYL